MRVIIQPDYAAVSRWAANYVAGTIKRSRPIADKPFVLGLPTGSTPIGMYDELAELNRKQKVSFKHVVTFNMDEYVGLPDDHPAGYHAFMWKHLFSRIDIPKDNVSIPDGNAPDLAAECAAYEDRIRQAGGVDLFIGGVGANGHIAFNEPGSSLTSRTRVVSLSHDTIVVNARFFDNDPDKVPRQALTVGIGTVMDARAVLILVTGGHKARALQHAIEQAVDPLWPASVLQTHPTSIILCDEAATAELNAGTIEHFQDAEAAGGTM